MPKYTVRCYYEYVGVVEIEAESPEEAFDKGFPLCESMGTPDLDYVGYTSSEVIDDTGEIQEFK